MTTGERIQGNIPLLGNEELAHYSTGLYNAEGYSYCKRRTGRRAGGPSRTVAITMCDGDALEPAARWWGLPVRPRGGRAMTCRDGPAFRIEASGLRAELIVTEMMKHGLSRSKREQWSRVVSQCGVKDSSRSEGVARFLGAVQERRTPSLSASTQAIRGDPPHFEDILSGHYSTGLFNGEGCSFCLHSVKSKPSAKIQVNMCDRDALEPVGRWWGVNVRPTAGKAKVCVSGPAYRIEASGARAEMIMNEMMKYGLSSRKIDQGSVTLAGDRAISCPCYMAGDARG